MSLRVIFATFFGRAISRLVVKLILINSEVFIKTRGITLFVLTKGQLNFYEIIQPKDSTHINP